MKWHLLARTAGIHDEWLESRLSQLSASQRNQVEDAVKKFSGGWVFRDIPAIDVAPVFPDQA